MTVRAARVRKIIKDFSEELTAKMDAETRVNGRPISSALAQAAQTSVPTRQTRVVTGYLDHKITSGDGLTEIITHVFCMVNA